ncbi:hypothetical protein ACFTZK_18785 [Streptomyces decoyicus]|uniref:hypothetical protein n=1 Tax=Streptomyces decoyicus TaxID=249567 RepID=UPI0036452288
MELVDQAGLVHRSLPGPGVQVEHAALTARATRRFASAKNLVGWPDSAGSATSSFSLAVSLGKSVSRSTTAVTKAGCHHQDFRTGRAGLEAVPEPVICDVP